MTGKLQRLIAQVTFDDISGRIVSLAVKTRHQERALDARLITIETRLGIPTPPKFAKCDFPAPAAESDGGHQ
jgi:hypothetical protein